MKTQKHYIDNIKVFMTMLVVLHHSVVTYGGPGNWYYSEKTTMLGALLPMTMFVATNQSFFMGFFFLLAAYFIPSSYDRKGRRKFLTDRLVRLGIPLLFYSFIFSPFLSYLVYYFAKGHHIPYVQYLSGFDGWIDFGVLWFAAALLLFTFLYVLWRIGFKPKEVALLAVPGAGKLMVFAVGLGVISFLIRILFPVGWVLKPVGFQLGHFTQYIVLFIFGLIAFRNNWLDQFSIRTGRKLGVTAILLLLVFPFFFVIKLKLDIPIAWYSGGLHWESLLYAVWEQCIGVSILISLLVLGKKYFNYTTPLLSQLSRSAFAVYIFHPLVIISLSLAFRNWPVDPFEKLLVVAPLAVMGSFLLGSAISRIPGVNRII